MSEKLKAGKENQKKIGVELNKLSESNKSKLAFILAKQKKGEENKNINALLVLKKELFNIKQPGDVDFLKKTIDVSTKFQTENSKLLNKSQKKDLNNYIITLKNLIKAGNYKETYLEEGKVKNTYPKGFITKKQLQTLLDFKPEKEESKEPPKTPPKPPAGAPAQPPAGAPAQPPAEAPEQGVKPKNLVEAFNRIKENKPGAYKDFTEVLGKTTAISIKKNFIKPTKDVKFKGYSKLKASELRKLVDDTIQEYARTEKLDLVLSDIGAPRVEFEKRKEKAEIEKMTESERELMFGKPEEFDIDEYLRKKYNTPRDKQLTEFLLSYDKRDNAVAYKTGRKIPEPGQFTKRNIRDSIDKFFTNNIYIQRLANEIGQRKDTKHFKELDKFGKADTINIALKADVSSDDLDAVLGNQEFKGFLSDVYVQVYGKPPDKPIESVGDYYNLVEDIRKLSASKDYNRLARIGADIIKYDRIVKDYETELTKLINKNVNTPAEVRVLPEGVKTRAVEEELLTDLDKYNKLAEELATETKKPQDEQDGDEIRRLKEEMKKYQAGAKKEKAKKVARDTRAATATRRKGAVRPHFKNVTEKAVAAAISETPQEQIADIKNWYIFDLPEYSTGVGNKVENPFVLQNTMRDRFMVSDTNAFTHLDSYLLHEGIEERKDFYKEHSDLSSGGISRGLLDVKYDETEQEFLQKFNSGSNGLFTQDQSKKEVSDFQNIYQTPARYIDGRGKPPQFTNNRGITHNDKVWIDNLNIFYKGAEVE
jgi:hypothetical protein